MMVCCSNPVIGICKKYTLLTKNTIETNNHKGSDVQIRSSEYVKIRKHLWKNLANKNNFPESDSIYLPIPRRDSPVNSMIRYSCIRRDDVFDNSDSVAEVDAIFASCFPDGNYRYPSTFPNCTRNSPGNICPTSSPHKSKISADNTHLLCKGGISLYG